MKILIFLIAVVLLLWLLRKSMRRGSPPPKPRNPAATPQAMLVCAHCGVHLPRDEALPGRGGVFCGEAHRTDYERAHPERP